MTGLVSSSCRFPNFQTLNFPDGQPHPWAPHVFTKPARWNSWIHLDSMGCPETLARNHGTMEHQLFTSFFYMGPGNFFAYLECINNILKNQNMWKATPPKSGDFISSLTSKSSRHRIRTCLQKHTVNFYQPL